MKPIELKERLKRIIIEVTHSNDGVDDIDDGDFLIDDLGVDSLGIMTLVENIERDFKIKIERFEVVVDNFKTVNHLTRYVGSKLSHD